MGAYELARTPRFTRLAQRVAGADRVYVAGFQTVRGVTLDFAQRLEYARPGVRFLDGADGTYPELFAPGGQRRLIVVDFRRYARQAALLVDETIHQIGPPVGERLATLQDRFEASLE